MLQEHFSEHTETALRDPLLYGDYRTALNPDVPRIYEDIQDYDAAKGLFEEVCDFAMIVIMSSIDVHFRSWKNTMIVTSR